MPYGLTGAAPDDRRTCRRTVAGERQSLAGLANGTRNMNENGSSKPAAQDEQGFCDDAGTAFQCGRTLVDEVTACLETIGPIRTAEALWPWVLSLSLFAKASKTYQAVQHLWTAGFVEDGLALSRTLFEIELIMKRIAADPAETSNTLMKAAQLEAAVAQVAFPDDGDTATAWLNLLFGGKVSEAAWVKRSLRIQVVGPPDTTERAADLNQNLDQIAQEMDFYAKGPLGASIWAMARDAGAERAWFYRTWYRLLSCIIHSHPSTYAWYQVPGEASCGFRFDPDPRDGRRTEGAILAVIATKLLLAVVEPLNEVLRLEQVATSIANARDALRAITIPMAGAG